jgi:subtilisin-like proprotein convertase family protein
MLNFNTQADFGNRYSPNKQVFKAPPLPNVLKTGLMVKVVTLVLCCFSFQSLVAQQCNIATPSGTNVNLYLGANGITTLNSNVFIPYVSSPNCPMGTIELWYDINATIPFPTMNYDCTNEGDVVPVFVTIEGPFSQSNAVLFTVNILDNAPPLVAWPANVNLPADPSACARVVNSLTPVVTDNCPGSYSLTWVRSGATSGSGSNSANGTYNVGTTTITYTLVDNHGTPNQVHTTTVTITDTQPPTFTPASLPNITTTANGSCVASVTWNGGNHPIASDNCALSCCPSGISTIQMTGATPLAAQNPSGVPLPHTFNRGVTTVIYTAFDGVNTTTFSFTVTVNDVTPPSFGAAPTVSTVSAVGCSAPVSINLTSFITDNCTIAGNIVKTFTVTTASSGSSPYPLNVPQNGAHVNQTFLAGVYTIVFKATDGSNNMQTHTLTLSVLENTAPVANCQNFTAYLDANGTVVVNAQSLDNGSTDNCAVTVYEMLTSFNVNWVTTQSFSCANIGNHTASFRVRDAAGNISAVCGPRTITIADNMPPVAQCKNITVSLNTPGGAPTTRTVVASEVNNMSYDNCTPMGSLVLEISEVFAGPYGPSVVFDCSDVPAPQTVYLRVTDAASNVSNICSAQVTVDDVTNPVAFAQNYVAVLNGSGIATVCGTNINNGSTDNCSITAYKIGTSAAGPFNNCRDYTCANLGANNAWLQVTDIDGNTHVTGPVTVTVQDNTNPVAACKNITANLNNAGTVTILATSLNNGSSDNCTITHYQVSLDGVTWSTTPTSTNSAVTFDCTDVGPNTVYFRVIDQSGNISNTCVSTVTVVDNVPPSLTCYAATLPLQSNGMVTVFPFQIAPLAFDICTPIILEISVDANNDNNPDVPFGPSYTFSCSDVGVNNVLIKATDGYGNFAICNSPVTIQDTEDPVITCPANLTIQCDDDQTPANTGMATATDNCPTPTIGVPVNVIVPSVGPGSCPQNYSILRTWTATDNYGNSSSCVQTITVEDTEAPTFTAPADVVLDCPGSYTVANQFCNEFAASTGLPVAISPNNSGVYTSTLNVSVPSNGKIMDINLTNLVIEHTWVGDLTVELISPLGTTILVGNFNPCGDEDNIDVSLDDEAVNAINCGQLNLGQTFQPSNLLAGFDGEMVNGTWTIRITDNAAFDGGALVGWALDICYVTQPQDLSLSGDVTDEDDNCDTPQADFVDYHAYKDFIVHAEGNAYTEFASWTGSAPDGGSVSATSTNVTLVSDNDGGTVGQVNYSLNSTLPASGYIVFDWNYSSANSSPFWDPFGYVLNGTFFQLSDNGGPLNQSGRVIIPVLSGQTFAFSQRSVDACCGAATTVVTNFLFTDQGMPVPIDGCERKFCVARFWSLSDACGNMADDQVQIIETRDVTAPVVNYPTTKNVLAQNGICSPWVDLNLSSFISDACSNYDDLIIINDALDSLGKGNGTFDASGFYSPGSYSISFTITDECGNVKNHTIALTVTDSQNPTAICQNAIVQLDNSGNATITPSSINNGSYDNCGIASMSVTPNTFTTADIGDNNVTLTVTDPAGNTNSCSAVVTVLGGVMFDAGDAAGATGNTVLVPVTVTNFDNIISFELDIDISNGLVATVNAIEGIHPSLAGMLFPITSPTHVDVSWIGGPLNLPDGTVAFNVRVNLVGTTGSSTPILINVVEVGTPSGITPSLGLSGTISIIDPSTMLAISGTLMQHVNSGNGQVHLTDVDYYGSVSGTVPNAPGAFSFNVPSGSNITVEPYKDINWNNGVTTVDALCTHYYSIGLPLPGSCTGPVTPYQKIAADANGNDAVTAFDAALIQQIAINNTPVVGNTSWRFVPTVPVLPADPFLLGFNEVRTYTNVTTNISNANFFGIKTGDVTASFANGVTGFNGNTGERGSNLILQVSDKAVAQGQDIAVTFKANGFNGIYSMQTTFNFDESVLKFVGASGNGLASIIFNSSMVADGKLATSWYNLDAVTLENGEELFTLHFKATGNGILSEMLSTSADLVVPEVATTSGDIIGVEIGFESFTATGEQAVGHFALHQNRPNPFSTRTAIGFNLPTADHAELTITDAAGKTLKMVEGNFTAGYHQFMIERKDLPATGVFFYQLKTANYQAVKKMILVD